MIYRNFRVCLIVVMYIAVLFSCSSDDSADDSTEDCPSVNNSGVLTIKETDGTEYVYNNISYCYLDIEEVDAKGNYVYEFIYSNYDVENTDKPITNGFRLRFKVVSEDSSLVGIYNLNNESNYISDVNVLYNYNTKISDDGSQETTSVDELRVDSMLVDFMEFDSCLNSEVKFNLEDNEIVPESVIYGSFNGQTMLAEIDNYECPSVINLGEMSVNAADGDDYSYQDISYCYLDTEEVDESGNSVYEFIYSNYDIKNIDEPIINGFRLRFKVVSEDSSLVGVYNLNDNSNYVSDIDVVYNYNTKILDDGSQSVISINKLDISSGSVNFMEFDSCLILDANFNLIDEGINVGVDGVFKGRTDLVEIK